MRTLMLNTLKIFKLVQFFASPFLTLLKSNFNINATTVPHTSLKHEIMPVKKYFTAT